MGIFKSFTGGEEPDEIRGSFDHVQEIKDLIMDSGADPEKVKTFLDELEEADEQTHNILFVSSDGEKTIKAIYVPAAGLNDQPGPVIFPSAKPDVVLAAFSKEFIENQMDQIEWLDVDQEDAEYIWENFIGMLHDMIFEELEYAEPFKWEGFNE